MKLAKLSTIALVSVIALAGVAQVSQAADVTPASSTATVKLSPATVTEQKPTGPIVDNTDKNDETGHEGPLSIDVRPFLEFGEAKVASGTTTLPIISPFEKSVQVTDTRGTGAGWDLKVKITEFQTADPAKKLAGAQLTLGFKELKTTNINNTNAPAYVETIDLNGSEQSLLSAAEGKGLGTWAYVIDKAVTKSKLVIPGGNYVGDYSATITWTLSDAPKP